MHRQLDGVQRRLVAVEHHELGRAEVLHLAAQLGADRSAGAGDEHALGGEIAGDRVEVGADLAAAEQVGLGQRPDVADADASVEQLVDRGQDLHLQPGVGADRRQLAHELGGRAGNGDEHRVGVLLFGEAGDVVAGSTDGHVADTQTLLARVVVDDGDGEVVALRVAQHRGDDLDRAFARADHEQSGRGVRWALAALEREPPPVTEAGHQRERDERGDDRHARRYGMRDGHGDRGRRSRDEHRAHERGDFLEAAEAEAADVEPFERADHELHQRDERESDRDATEVKVVERELEPQAHAEHERHPPRAEVERDAKDVPLRNQSDVEIPPLAAQGSHGRCMSRVDWGIFRRSPCRSFRPGWSE